jgi:hypothetical protein
LGSPSHCQFDTLNDAFPEVGICGEKRQSRRLILATGGFAVCRAVPVPSRLVRKDQARRIAVNIAKLHCAEQLFFVQQEQQPDFLKYLKKSPAPQRWL